MEFTSMTLRSCLLMVIKSTFLFYLTGQSLIQKIRQVNSKIYKFILMRGKRVTLCRVIKTFKKNLCSQKNSLFISMIKLLKITLLNLPTKNMINSFMSSNGSKLNMRLCSDSAIKFFKSTSLIIRKYYSILNKKLFFLQVKKDKKHIKLLPKPFKPKTAKWLVE